MGVTAISMWSKVAPEGMIPSSMFRKEVPDGMTEPMFTRELPKGMTWVSICQIGRSEDMPESIMCSRGVLEGITADNRCRRGLWRV